MHVFMMVGETGVPGVNPHRHGENMQTPHRKDLERPGTTGMRTHAHPAARRQTYPLTPRAAHTHTHTPTHTRESTPHIIHCTHSLTITYPSHTHTRTHTHKHTQTHIHIHTHA